MTETMREAVARAMDRSLRLRSCGETPPIEPDMVLPYIEGAVDLDVLAQDAIRTVLERLDDPTDAMVEAGNRTAGREAQWHCDVADIFRAMLAAITPPLPESADSGRR